jgi:hypothetical protein
LSLVNLRLLQVINLGTNDHLGTKPEPKPDAAGFLVFAGGVLSAGNDLIVSIVSSIGDAEAWCQGNSSCSGFTTRKVPEAGSGKYHVYFKHAQGLGPNSDVNWTSYVKVGEREGPPHASSVRSSRHGLWVTLTYGPGAAVGTVFRPTTRSRRRTRYVPCGAQMLRCSVLRC